MVKAKRSAENNNNNNNGEEEQEEQRPGILERKRLKKLAISKGILSESSGAGKSDWAALAPSKTVLKHQGKDILRKSQRKNRFLFSFPGLLAPIAGGGGGKIGDLKHLSTKNPILYLHFPQGQMKLFGTVVYPKNRYLTLHFSRGGKNVLCEDYFDNMILFSEACWIGKKEDNPEEAPLDFPKGFIEFEHHGQGQRVDYDFNGGAGAGPLNQQFVHKAGGTKYVENESPETELEDGLSDDRNVTENLKEATPVRHSGRTAGKTFKFAEVSSGDDSIESNADDSKEEDEEENKVKKNNSSAILPDIDDESFGEGIHFCEQIQASALSVTKSSKKLSESVASMTTTKEKLHSNHGSLLQSTISTLFKKVQEKKEVEEKKVLRSSRKSPSSKVYGQKLQQLKRKIDQAEGPQKKGKVTEPEKAGTRTKAKKKVYEVEDDDIEELSSSSQDTEGSDEDWEA